MKWLLVFALISSYAIADSAVQINFNAPTRRIDGKPLSIQYIDHYNIYVQSPNAVDDEFITKDGWEIKPEATQITIPLIDNIPGSWCFKISIVDTSNNESGLSNRACIRLTSSVDIDAPYYQLTLNVVVQEIPQIAIEVPK